MSEGKADKSTDKVRVSTGKVRVNTMKFNDSQKMVIEFLQKNDRVTNKENPINFKASYYILKKRMNHLWISVIMNTS